MKYLKIIGTVFFATSSIIFFSWGLGLIIGAVFNIDILFNSLWLGSTIGDLVMDIFGFLVHFIFLPFWGLFVFGVVILFPVTIILVTTNTILVPILEKNNRLFDIIHNEYVRVTFIVITVAACIALMGKYAWDPSLFDAYTT